MCVNYLEYRCKNKPCKQVILSIVSGFSMCPAIVVCFRINWCPVVVIVVMSVGIYEMS